MAIWHNGQLRQTPTIDASSAGLLLGWGVFTTIGIRNGRALWPEKHIARLKRDAAKCEIDIPFSDEILHDGLGAVLRENGVQNGLARLTATRCDDGRWNTDVRSDLTILALQSAPTKTRGLRVTLTNSPDLSRLSGVKTTSYLPYLWEWRRAIAEGFDEVILFDSGDRAVEAARSSAFWVRGGKLETSPLSSGALEGVGRAVVWEWAKANGVEARASNSSWEDLRRCDEVFLVSAATGPRLIRTLCDSGGESVLPPEGALFEQLRTWWDEQ